MTKEVAVKDLDFSVAYKKSEINVANKEQFEMAIKAYADKYKGLVFNSDNVAEAKSVRAEMNKVKKGLADKRIEIKNDFNKPLDDFEKWVNKQSAVIDTVVSPIDKGIKEVEKAEQEARHEKLLTEIEEMALNYEVKADEITINPSWSNKSSFTPKGKLTSKTLKEIAAEMTFVKSQKDQLEANKILISNYAAAVGLEPEAWALQVVNGATTKDLMKQIDQTIKAKNQRLEAEKKKKEYESAIASIHPKQIIVADKAVDEETGEILGSVNIDDLPFGDEEDPFPVKKPAIKIATYRLSAPAHLIMQATQYMKGLGIKVEEVTD